MNNNGLTVPAFRFKQANRTFYSTFLTGRMLLEGVAKVDEWSPKNPRGYQRAPSTKRQNKVAAFLRGAQGVPGVLPQSVLLGMRGKAEFKKADEKFGMPWDYGLLKIHKKELPLYEDDGQHRIGGLLKAAQSDEGLLDFPLPAIIAEDVTPLQQAVAFYVINTTSVKVAVDLAQRLIAQQDKDPQLHTLLVETGKDWVARATYIVDVLNDTPDQPWEQFIVVPGGEIETGIKQNTMVRSLHPLLAANSLFQRVSAEKNAELLVRYWRAIGQLWPEAVKRDTRDDYVLMQSIGVLAMHNLAPAIFEAAIHGGTGATQEGIRRVLEPMAKKYRVDSWSSKTGEFGKIGTNNKAVRYLADLLSKEVQTEIVNFD